MSKILFICYTITLHLTPSGEGRLRRVAGLIMVLKKVGIPISQRNIVGPETVIGYLGIVPDSK